MAAPRAAKKGMSRGGKIALIVGISAVVLILAIIGVAVFLFIGAITAPADVANNYMMALNDGDLSNAWGYLSEDAKKVETRSDFISEKEYFKGEIESYNTSGIEVSNGHTQVTMDIKYRGGERDTWNMYLVKENGEWRIENIEVD